MTKYISKSEAKMLRCLSQQPETFTFMQVMTFTSIGCFLEHPVFNGSDFLPMSTDVTDVYRYVY